VYNLEVPLAVAAHSCGAHYLLAAFIKHLVFAREQCHAPFNELENHVQVYFSRCLPLQYAYVLEASECRRSVGLPSSRSSCRSTSACPC
jgi:hypothetical protein